jgi:hypothetical protein
MGPGRCRPTLYSAVMPKIRLTNDRAKILAVWVEPWAEDYWMSPRGVFTVASVEWCK